MPGLTIRKHADRNTPVPRTLTGVSLHGYRLGVDPPPDKPRVSTTVVEEGISEGWITAEGSNHVHRPGGPPEDEYRVTHSFRHADALVFHTLDGDIRFTVTHQPDKYADSGDKAKVTKATYAAGDTHVDWFYDLERS